MWSVGGGFFSCRCCRIPSKPNWVQKANIQYSPDVWYWELLTTSTETGGHPFQAGVVGKILNSCTVVLFQPMNCCFELWPAGTRRPRGRALTWGCSRPRGQDTLQQQRGAAWLCGRSLIKDGTSGRLHKSPAVAMIHSGRMPLG